MQFPTGCQANDNPNSQILLLLFAVKFDNLAAHELQAPQFVGDRNDFSYEKTRLMPFPVGVGFTWLALLGEAL